MSKMSEKEEMEAAYKTYPSTVENWMLIRRAYHESIRELVDLIRTLVQKLGDN